jgi:hypothetical protein
MITNVGVIERTVRLCLGLALLAWAHGSIGPLLNGSTALVVFGGGAFLTFTGLFRFCPFYAAVDINTCAPADAPDDKKESRKEPHL